MKVVEVYPGDGSVLVSQGPSAHFFQHIIPHDGKVQSTLDTSNFQGTEQNVSSYQ